MRLVRGYTIRRYAPMVITVMRQVVDTGWSQITLLSLSSLLAAGAAHAD